MSERTLAKEELIGLPVTVNQCKDPNWINKTGVIIDETKNTFLIRLNNKDKRIAKSIAKFEFEQDGAKIQLNGSKIVYKPEDRIKKAR
ncbi:MAG: ribonuclease P protein subunit [Candidatus Thermoplasmatota archaeon]|nr:ribonuclease P protein subunit [Candidatus Thermoplasmatota archaeon]